MDTSKSIIEISIHFSTENESLEQLANLAHKAKLQISTMFKGIINFRHCLYSPFDIDDDLKEIVDIVVGNKTITSWYDDNIEEKKLDMLTDLSGTGNKVCLFIGNIGFSTKYDRQIAEELLIPILYVTDI